jgi:hypothetical protein
MSRAQIEREAPLGQFIFGVECGMSIGSVSLFGGSAQATAAARKSALQQRSTDFSSLAQALSCNNLSGAKSAFAALQKDAQQVAATHGNSPSTQQNCAAVQLVKSDAQTLATALSANKLGAAQKAFASLKQDSANTHRGGYHGHLSGLPILARTSGNTSPAGTSSDYRAAEALSTVGGTLNLSAGRSALAGDASRALARQVGLAKQNSWCTRIQGAEPRAATWHCSCRSKKTVAPHASPIPDLPGAVARPIRSRSGK